MAYRSGTSRILGMKLAAQTSKGRVRARRSCVGGLSRVDHMVARYSKSAAQLAKIAKRIRRPFLSDSEAAGSRKTISRSITAVLLRGAVGCRAAMRRWHGRRCPVRRRFTRLRRVVRAQDALADRPG